MHYFPWKLANFFLNAAYCLLYVILNILFHILGGGLGGGGHGGQEIPIISYSNENAGDGNYQYNYETGNGIRVQETGHQQGRRLHFYFLIKLFLIKLLDC